ncbi:hypothetical protein ASPCAL14330 [Aspergillus calidoustus]|uniref:Uncharacterized protein n=1 Tax=Aspergillus calidoustus TaxID=454130 RepID=A0A0U5GGU2_ASPCI|nr:hypothetical protein ASPCAL14330 [Aspergillus calidoustus]
MAYEAAAGAGAGAGGAAEGREGKIDPVLLRLYEIGAVKSDLAAYVEHGIVARTEVFGAEDACIEELGTRLGRLLDGLDIGAYCKAPILSEELWERFVGTLDTFGSEGLVSSR